MREKPIIFSGEMVREILSGRKTMTRRTKGLKYINKNPGDWKYDGWGHIDGILCFRFVNDKSGESIWLSCPFGQIGDYLWIKETFTATKDRKTILYREGDFYRDMPKSDFGRDWNWTPSIYMPRWASRITIEIKNVRVERLQEISEEDARKEGIKLMSANAMQELKSFGGITEQTWARNEFTNIWDSINGKKYSWASNPFCWVIEFERIQP